MINTDTSGIYSLTCYHSLRSSQILQYPWDYTFLQLLKTAGGSSKPFPRTCQPSLSQPLYNVKSISENNWQGLELLRWFSLVRYIFCLWFIWLMLLWLLSMWVEAMLPKLFDEVIFGYLLLKFIMMASLLMCLLFLGGAYVLPLIWLFKVFQNKW